jgi:hypothetical protein
MNPETPDMPQQVETKVHLTYLKEKYGLFMAEKRLERIIAKSGPQRFEYGYWYPILWRRGMPGASDEWLVHKPYDPLVNTNTEKIPYIPPTRSLPEQQQDSSIPRSWTRMTPGTP